MAATHTLTFPQPKEECVDQCVRFSLRSPSARRLAETKDHSAAVCVISRQQRHLINLQAALKLEAVGNAVFSRGEVVSGRSTCFGEHM